MTLTNHIKYSTLAAIALAPVLRRRVIPFWLAAIFIDLDQVPGMVRRCSINPLDLVRFALAFRIPPGRDPIGMRMSRPLHHPVLAMAALALAPRHPAMLGVGLGMLFHLLLDHRDRWLGTRLGQGVTERQQHRCHMCDREEEMLQGHHVRSCPPQSLVPLDDLVGLCDRCHAIAHVAPA